MKPFLFISLFLVGITIELKSQCNYDDFISLEPGINYFQAFTGLMKANTFIDIEKRPPKLDERYLKAGDSTLFSFIGFKSTQDCIKNYEHFGYLNFCDDILYGIYYTVIFPSDNYLECLALLNRVRDDLVNDFNYTYNTVTLNVNEEQIGEGYKFTNIEQIGSYHSPTFISIYYIIDYFPEYKDGKFVDSDKVSSYTLSLENIDLVDKSIIMEIGW